MSKTNHRINKDRGERLGESKAHRKRRDIHQKVKHIIELYDSDEDLEEIFDSDEWDRYEKRTKPV